MRNASDFKRVLRRVAETRDTPKLHHSSVAPRSSEKAYLNSSSRSVRANFCSLILCTYEILMNQRSCPMLCIVGSLSLPKWNGKLIPAVHRFPKFCTKQTGEIEFLEGIATQLA